MVLYPFGISPLCSSEQSGYPSWDTIRLPGGGTGDHWGIQPSLLSKQLALLSKQVEWLLSSPVFCMSLVLAL